MGANDARRNGAAITEETVKNNIGNDGYLVQYPDGYRSWSPKKVFDEAYRLSETKVDRMKIELADLNERIKETADTLSSILLVFRMMIVGISTSNSMPCASMQKDCMNV